MSGPGFGRGVGQKASAGESAGHNEVATEGVGGAEHVWREMRGS